MKIIIGSDLVPTKSNVENFKTGNISGIIDEKLQRTLSEAEFRIFNLEVPLTDREAPIKKCGPNLIAPTECINGIKKLGVDLFTLANNHIMDQGVQGFKSTIDTLKESEIDYVGAGENLSEAQKTYIIEKEGIKIGIYACAEHEFSIAEENYPGANPFDPLESLDHIVDLKNECDYVIVLYHGGKEHYRYPSPYLQKVCRKMCDKGADLVVCQHSHCIGCEEKYNNSTIVYGQGNFIFDEENNEFWDNAILISVDFAEKMEIKYVPIEKINGKILLSENKNILSAFFSRSKKTLDYDFIKNEYSRFAERYFQTYLYSICGVSFFFRVINKLCMHRLKWKIKDKRRFAIRNYIECEAHRELLIEGLKDRGEIYDQCNNNDI